VFANPERNSDACVFFALPFVYFQERKGKLEGIGFSFKE
jgi:hypothetical protein